jgi:hypothetical protein
MIVFGTFLRDLSQNEKKKSEIKPSSRPYCSNICTVQLGNCNRLEDFEIVTELHVYIGTTLP